MNGLALTGRNNIPRNTLIVMEEEMKTNDRVIVVKSPYSDVPAGTRGTVRKIYPNHFGQNESLYELQDMSSGDHRLFRDCELVLYPREGK